MRGERAFEHGGAGLSEMADWIRAFAAEEAGEIGLAVETARGPVVESLMERGFVLHSSNPGQLGRFRDRFFPHGTLRGVRRGRGEVVEMSEALAPVTRRPVTARPGPARPRCLR